MPYRITDNLNDTGSELLYKNKAVLTALELSNCYFISPNGDDATGIKGRIDKPFKTLKSVFAVISANEAVYFFPGTYAVGSDTVCDKAGIHIYLQSATINGNIYLPAGNGTYSSDGNGVINGDVGIYTIDNTKTYWVKNLKKCQLGRGTIYVDGVYEITLLSDACRYYIHNVQKLSAHTSNGGIIELINVREITNQTGMGGLRGTYVRDCRFYTNAVGGSNFVNGGNSLGANEDSIVFRDCEFVSVNGHNFQINLEDIAGVYSKFINCRFYAGAAYHVDTTLLNGFPNSKVNLKFISCDFNRLPIIKASATATASIDFSLTPNLTDNNTDLLYKGLGIATVANLGTVAFVSQYGSNATGIVGRLDRPYKTIQYAVDNAIATTLVVLGGTYNEQLTIPNGPMDRILLWFGASITSNQAYTVSIAKPSFVIEGQALVSQTINFGWFYPQNSAIINTNATGVCITRGANPGAVPLFFYNLFIQSTGTDLNNAACMFAWNHVILKNCRLHAYARVFKGIYGNSVHLQAYDCVMSSAQTHIVDMTNLGGDNGGYDGFYGYLERCRFNAPYGFHNGQCAGSELLFRDCHIESTIGYAFKHSPAYASGAKLILENCTVKAQTRILEGNVNSFQVIGGQMQSLTAIPFSFYFYAGATAELRDTKIIAEASQANCIVNSNASNKSINLINVSMNKPHDANVAGVIHNVLIEDSLTAL